MRAVTVCRRDASVAILSYYEIEGYFLFVGGLYNPYLIMQLAGDVLSAKADHQLNGNKPSLKPSKDVEICEEKITLLPELGNLTARKHKGEYIILESKVVLDNI